MILVDTNVLLRSAQPTHAMHPSAVSAVSKLRADSEILCIVPQVLYEYWAVATRPAGLNGLGMSAVDAGADLAEIIETFQFMPDGPGVFDSWRRLVALHQVLGKNAHDARLVAAMEMHGIKGILSFNASDFRRYADIDVIDPIAFAAT